MIGDKILYATESCVSLLTAWTFALFSFSSRIFHIYWILREVGGKQGNFHGLVMSPNWFSLKLKVVINILSHIFGPQYIGSGGLPSLGSHRVGYDWSDLAAAAAAEWLLWLSECVQRTLLKSWNLHWMTTAVSHKETKSADRMDSGSSFF